MQGFMQVVDRADFLFFGKKMRTHVSSDAAGCAPLVLHAQLSTTGEQAEGRHRLFSFPI